MITLRPYQAAASDAVLRYWEAGGGNPLIEVPTGAGKSLIAADIVRRVIASGKHNVAVVTHRKELIEQDARAIDSLIPGAPMGVWSASVGQRSVDRITVCGVQTAVRQPDRLGKISVAVVDECFVAETMISTPSGQIRIDKVRPGDKVICATGVGTVVATSVKPSTDLVEVIFDDGTKTVCTSEHRFFTRGGWASASSMDVGEIVFRKETVRELWKYFPPAPLGKKNRRGRLHVGTCMERAGVLLSVLLEEAQESHAEQKINPQDARVTAKDKAQADQERRQRAIATLGPDSNIARARRRVGIGGGDPDESQKREWLPNLLQVGHSEQGKKNRNRARWGVTHSKFKERAGRKENGSSGFARVVSVSRIKSKSARAVFNLHVDGHPSYFANGHLVHNCHLVSPSGNTMYARFFDGLRKNNPDLRVVGLTATPYRVGQGVLTWGEDKIFDSIVYRVAMRDLVREGYLSPIVTGAATASINVDGVGIKSGEYILRDLELAANVDSITQTVAGDIAKSGMQHVLVFGVSIKHAMALRDALLFAGVDTRVVSGEMPKHERAQIIEDFKAGRIRCLASCDVLTTGFDAPAIDCVAIVRATMSPGLFVQMAGRGSRLSPGKQECMLLDYGGNLARHGPIDDINPPKNKVKRGPGDAPFKSCPKCFAECHTMSLVCEHCGFEFPLPERKANKQASTLPAMSMQEKAPPKTWEVKRTEYSRHKGKDGKPDTFKVSYFSTENADDDGEDMIPQWKRWPIASEWLCFDHEDGSWPYKKASSWWSSRSQGRIPRSVGDALDCVVDLPETYEITTEAEGKYTRVISAKWKHIEQVSDSTNGGDVDPVQQWVDNCEDLPF